MSQERFQLLMRQYLNDQIDQPGLTELQALLDSKGYESGLEMLYKEIYESPELKHSLPAERSNAILSSILYPGTTINNAGLSKAGQTPIGKARTIRRLWIMGSAAAILILLLAIYLIVNKKPADQSTLSTIVATHSDKAILTLADGRQIVLDSTGKGDIATQNSVLIEKAGSGQLSYVDQPNGAKNSTPQYNTLITPRGGQFQLLLPDGTHVWLNSASSLRYPVRFDTGSRQVELKGEAYFEVAKDIRRPFTVAADKLSIAVLGTSIDVMAYADEPAIRTTLITGSVKLSSQQNTKLLLPGEQGALIDDQFTVSRPDVDEVLAWKNGEFRFTARPISAIMRQMARWYDVDVNYEGKMPDNLLNGDIRQGRDISDVLDMLETTRIVHFKREGRKITVIAGPTTH